MEMTMQDLLDKQSDPSWRLLSVEDLDFWAKIHDWLLVKVKTVGTGMEATERHYLTPNGNELIFHIDNPDSNVTSTVFYVGQEKAGRKFSWDY